MGFRITTWNVNGIRNPFSYQPWSEKRSFESMFDILEADIVVIQETKIQRKDLRDDMVLVPGWDVYFSLPRHKKGYSGVAIYTRNSTCCPIRSEEGITGILPHPKTSTSFRDLPQDQQIGGYPRPGQLSGVVDEITLDSEGRCVILEFPAFVLLGVYSPANRDESRDDFRLGFLEALDIRIRNLVSEGKQVVLTGDLNILRSEMDVTNASEHIRKHGLTPAEWMSQPSRRLFNQLVFDGWVQGERDEWRERPVLWDLCRFFHPTRQGMNTCWDTKKNTRPANNGGRIDYVLCSNGLKDWFVDSNIQEGLMGSDHCPVFAVMADTVTSAGKEVFLSDMMNPPGMFQDGKRLRDWVYKDLLPMSAKLIPEFDRRQSIRDMFTRKTTEPSSSSEVPSATQSGTSATSNGVAPTDAAPENNDKGTNGPSGSEATDAGDGPGTISPASWGPKNSKRLAEPAGNPAKVKRSRPTEASKDPKLKLAPRQKTLQGFFKPKNSSPSKTEDEAVPVSGVGIPPAHVNNVPDPTHPGRPHGDQGRTPLKPERSIAEPHDERVFDPIEAKESWSKLLGRRTVPRCEHGEPCISLVTKKPGVNCGRSFYICPRPLGPSGEKEKDSEWRCATFIWSSDWGGTATS